MINYIESKYHFNERFPNIVYLITEENFNKLKTKILGSIKNISIEDIFKSVKTIYNKK